MRKHWWNKLSVDQRRDYVRQHPGSRYAQKVNAPVTTAPERKRESPATKRVNVKRETQGEAVDLLGNAVTRKIVDTSVSVALTANGLGNIDGIRAGRLPVVPMEPAKVRMDKPAQRAATPRAPGSDKLSQAERVAALKDRAKSMRRT